jgi:hypothetical protein
VGHGLHAAGVLVLRMGALQGRVMGVGGGDGRVIDLVVGALDGSGVVVWVRVPGLERGQG